MKLSMTIFFIAGVAAAADGSVAAQRGSLRALGKGGVKGATNTKGKPETTPYKVPPAHGLYKGPNLERTNPNPTKPTKPTKPIKPTKPTIDWRCKDFYDSTDWLTSCNNADAGKDGLDTCQPCCECDCDSSADVPDATTKATCEDFEEYELADDGVTKVLQGEYTCADHGHVDPVDNNCDHADVVAACDAICNA